jgi:hypothetical protein
MHHVLMLMPVLALAPFLVLPWPCLDSVYSHSQRLSIRFLEGMQALRRPPVTGKKIIAGPLSPRLSLGWATPLR